MNAPELIAEIIATAEQSRAVSQTQLLKKAGLYQSGISRIRATKDCRFSTIERLLAAGQLRLVVVADDSAAELLAKGELF